MPVANGRRRAAAIIGHAAESGGPPVRTEALGLLAAGIAHDMNGMLAGISATAQMLAVRPGRSAEDRGDLDDIVGQVDRVAALMRQLLAFARKETLHAAPLDLSAVASGLAPALRAHLGTIALELDLAHVATVAADRLAIERVLMNLVLNARDAITAAPGAHAGRILMETRQIMPYQRPAAAAFMPPARYVLLSVSDSGPGIESAIAARIFEPYFTTRSDGHGLGLSVAFGLIKQSGGFLVHDRGPLGGARFRIFLPAS